MLSLLSYLAICVVVVIVMVVSDEDTRSVSGREWLMLAVMVYAASQAIRKMVEIYKKGSWD